MVEGVVLAIVVVHTIVVHAEEIAFVYNVVHTKENACATVFCKKKSMFFRNTSLPDNEIFKIDLISRLNCNA